MAVVNGVAGVVILGVSCVLSAVALAGITKGLLWTLKRRSRD
jgi:hypothetical protein